MSGGFFALSLAAKLVPPIRFRAEETADGSTACSEQWVRHTRAAGVLRRDPNGAAPTIVGARVLAASSGWAGVALAAARNGSTGRGCLPEAVGRRLRRVFLRLQPHCRTAHSRTPRCFSN